MDRGRKKGRKGKECELCQGTARMYCESDEAMLCWECDARVHGANFLVARHTRALLCRTCQSPTPWRASGSRLGPSVSLCHRCSPPSQSPADDLRLGREGGARSDSESEDDDDGDGENGEEDEGDSEMEDSEGSAAAAAAEEEEGENQVVPWSPPPPTTTSSSSSEEEESSRAEMGAGICGGSGSSLKRMRDNADLASHPQDDLPSSSLQLSRFPSAQPPLFSGRTAAADDDDDDGDDDGETTSGGGGGSNRAGFQLPKDRRRRLAQPTSSTRRSQPTTAGEPCGSSRAAISTIDFVQAT